MNLQEYSYNIVNNLYRKTVDTVNRIQGKKKYISIQSDNCDKMYFYSYDPLFGDNAVIEGVVRRIRIYQDNLQFLGTTRDYIDKFDDDDFERASENYDNAKHLDDYELCWQDVQYSETTLLVQTLFSIAEVIEEYENK